MSWGVAKTLKFLGIRWLHTLARLATGDFLTPVPRDGTSLLLHFQLHRSLERIFATEDEGRLYKPALAPSTVPAICLYKSGSLLMSRLVSVQGKRLGLHPQRRKRPRHV